MKLVLRKGVRLCNPDSVEFKCLFKLTGLKSQFECLANLEEYSMHSGGVMVFYVTFREYSSADSYFINDNPISVKSTWVIISRKEVASDLSRVVPVGFFRCFNFNSRGFHSFDFIQFNPRYFYKVGD